MSRIILIVGGLCLLFALVGAIVLSRAIATPIISLAKHVGRIRDENIDRPVEVKSRDEIGILGSGLNIMLGRVNDLLVKVKEEQQLKREYEFALVQNQIKPHFFYNTLDLIYVLCKSGENEEAGKATKALADFYRIALSNGKEIITVRKRRAIWKAICTFRAPAIRSVRFSHRDSVRAAELRDSKADTAAARGERHLSRA